MWSKPRTSTVRGTMYIYIVLVRGTIRVPRTSTIYYEHVRSVRVGVCVPRIGVVAGRGRGRGRS